MTNHPSSTDSEARPVFEQQQDNGAINTNEAAEPTAGTSSSEEQVIDLSLEELLYSSSSYHAIAKPVSITMILAALCVVFINTEETVEEGEEAISSAYSMFDAEDAETNTSKALLSFANALIIVCAIGTMTFVIVLLYKYRCMMCLVGYMVFAFTNLLGILGGVMFTVAVNKYNLHIDKISFYVTLYNFAVVGCVAVFFQKGVPTLVNQAYLICISAILAWELSYFNEYLAWALLIMLALYDLCAVLTPCGPLKLLVNLMSQEGSPEMPGLLYEASLPEEARRPSRAPSRSSSTVAREDGPSRSSSRSTRENTQPRAQQQQQQQQQDPSTFLQAHDESSRTESTMASIPAAGAASRASNTTTSRARSGRDTRGYDKSAQEKSEATDSDMTPPLVTVTSHSVELTPVEQTADSTRTDTPSDQAEPEAPPPPPSTMVLPFAIARLYRLPLVSPEDIVSYGQSTSPLLENVESNGGPSSPPPHTSPRSNFSREQLLAEVEVQLPRRGGRIERGPTVNGEQQFIVKDRRGNIRRVLSMDRDGKVYEETDDDDGQGGGVGGKNTIKLGLGDFIFYSVLVSKAAQYSFTTFAACMLVILGGLGGTLVLLAVYRHALPALPISIFLGVIFYLLTRLVIEPWIEMVLTTPFYV